MHLPANSTRAIPPTSVSQTHLWLPTLASGFLMQGSVLPVGGSELLTAKQCNDPPRCNSGTPVCELSPPFWHNGSDIGLILVGLELTEHFLSVRPLGSCCKARAVDQKAFLPLQMTHRLRILDLNLAVMLAPHDVCAGLACPPSVYVRSPQEIVLCDMWRATCAAIDVGSWWLLFGSATASCTDLALRGAHGACPQCLLCCKLSRLLWARRQHGRPCAAAWTKCATMAAHREECVVMTCSRKPLPACLRRASEEARRQS